MKLLPLLGGVLLDAVKNTSTAVANGYGDSDGIALCARAHIDRSIQNEKQKIEKINAFQ